jgi:hypothetical protein
MDDSELQAVLNALNSLFRRYNLPRYSQSWQ